MKNTERKTIGATAAMNAGRERVELPTKDADVERFLLEKQADGKAANTIRAYHASLAKLANMATDSLAGLTRDGFTRLVIELNGSKSVRWHLVVLRMYLTWKGIDTRGWPKGRYNGNANRWKDPAALLTRDEVAKMISGETDPRDRSLLAVLWDTGRRIHEVLALDIADLNTRDGLSVRFRKSKIASEAGTRVRLIESADAVRKWLSVHPLLMGKGTRTDGPLFVTSYNGEWRRMSYSAALNTVQHAAAKVGIGKRVFPHLMRHSRATELRLVGVSDDAIRLRLGWTRGSAMISRYVSLADEQADDEVVAKLGLKVERRPVKVRALEMGAEIPELSDELDTLKARLADIERGADDWIRQRAEVLGLTAALNAPAPSSSGQPILSTEQKAQVVRRRAKRARAATGA